MSSTIPYNSSIPDYYFLRYKKKKKKRNGEGKKQKHTKTNEFFLRSGEEKKVRKINHQKNDKTERSRTRGRKTREEIGKGIKRKLCDSRQGRGIRHPWPPLGAITVNTDTDTETDTNKFIHTEYRHWDTNTDTNRDTVTDTGTVMDTNAYRGIGRPRHRHKHRHGHEHRYKDRHKQIHTEVQTQTKTYT